MQKELITDLFDLLEKTAGEADRLEKDNARLQTELEEAKKTPKEAAAKPAFTPALIEKLAGVLLLEGFLDDKMDKKAAADLMCRKPDALADLMLRVVTPPQGEGVPVGPEKTATDNLPKGARRVVLQGRELVDYAGWSSIIDLD